MFIQRTNNKRSKIFRKSTTFYNNIFLVEEFWEEKEESASIW